MSPEEVLVRFLKRIGHNEIVVNLSDINGFDFGDLWFCKCDFIAVGIEIAM